MRNITLKPRLKRSGKSLKASWYCLEDKCDMSAPEIADSITDGSKVGFDMTYTGIYRDKFNPHELLFNLVNRIELRNGDIDTGLTKRILENGGLFAYVRILENRVL